MESEPANTTFQPPYISFSQLENTLERMRLEGIPSRVDRSYLSSWSGSAQSQFLSASRALGLLEPDSGRPTQLLVDLVREPEQRPERIRQILSDKYPEALGLGSNATQSQLEEVFRSYNGISGSTVRKAIEFFLHAARFADVPLSPHFRAPKARGSAPNKPRAKRSVPGADPPNPPNPLVGVGDAEQRKAYIDLLMAKAQEEGDPDLYARIEWLLGFRKSPPDLAVSE